MGGPGSFEEGIQHAQQSIKGSCSMLLLTEKGIYAARDRLGRTPIVIGKKKGAFAAASESCSFPNLGYEIETHLGFSQQPIRNSTEYGMFCSSAMQGNIACIKKHFIYNQSINKRHDR